MKRSFVVLISLLSDGLFPLIIQAFQKAKLAQFSIWPIILILLVTAVLMSSDKSWLKEDHYHMEN